MVFDATTETLTKMIPVTVAAGMLDRSVRGRRRRTVTRRRRTSYKPYALRAKTPTKPKRKATRRRRR